MVVFFVAVLSFSSLMMLGWAGAAMVPVIIHLLNRRRRSTVPWAAIQLLRRVIEREARRANFQQWVLLMLRIAILLCLSLALARPYLTTPVSLSQPLAARPNKLWIIAVDTSYSMGYRSGDMTRMERAKHRAARLIADSQTGDAFALIEMNQPSQAVIGHPTFDGEGVLAEIQRLADNALGCDPLSALSIAEDIVAETRVSPDFPLDRELVVITDFGEDAWQSATDGTLAQALQRVGQLVNVTLESVIESKPVNVAIESVGTSANRTTTGNSVKIEVTVASYGQPVNSLPVQMEMDGQIVGSQLVDIPTDGRRTVSFLVTPQQSGSRILSVILPPDNLTIDNRYELVLDVRQGYRILIVETLQGSPSAWQLALRPIGTENWLGRSAEVRVVSELSWLNMRDSEWDAIILNDLPLVASQIGRLARFVKAGGSAIIALGKNFTGTTADNTALEDVATSSRDELLGFRVLRSSNVQDWEIDPLDYSSPITQIFEGFPTSGLLTTPIFRFWTIESQKSSLVVDLATLSGEPLIVRHRLEKGTVASFLSAPEDGRPSDGREGWNAMTTWPSFLPLAQQLVRVLLEADSLQVNFTAGQTLSGSVHRSDPTQTTQLIRPDQSEVLLTVEQQEGFASGNWFYSATDQRGIYRIVQEDNIQGLFAVNIDSVQSNLRSIQPQSIRMTSTTTAIHSTAESPPGRLADGIARSLLICLVLMLVAESLTARVLGRRIG